MPVPILMPALSPTMEEGTLARWLVKEGDRVAPGDVIAEIETDKATMEVEAADEGRIGRILVPEGSEGIRVNQPIAVLLEEGEDESALEGFDPGGLGSGEGTAQATAPAAPPAASQANGPDTPAAPAPSPAAASVQPPAPPASSAPPAGPAREAPAGGRIFASPLARRLAAQLGIDLATLQGSGPHGRIVKADVERTAASAAAPAAAPSEAQETPASAPSSAPVSAGALPDPRRFYAPDSYEEIPLDGMRRAIARRLTQSMQEIPHFYLSMDCELDALLRVREELNARTAGDGVRISVNDFIIRAAALALMKVPECNVSFAGDAILRHRHADIGVAVALEGGLITPIIRAAETKGLAQIAAEARDLAERARARRLKPADYEGGSFSISNLGMYDIKSFTAVINPPQAAIMAVGKGEARAVVREGALSVATVMTVTLSCDHRAIDGATGARLLGAFRDFIENPLTMLL